MDILTHAYTFLQTRLLPIISPKHKGLFTFGFEALTLRPFVSLNSNARMTIANRYTAQSKIYRLVSNAAMPTYFTQFVSQLGLVKKDDIVNVDFSTFCGFEVLTFAKQTHLGRAISLFFAIITYPVDVGSQTRFIMETIRQFVSLVGFTPHLVFGRGFESPFIVPFLVNEQIPFTMRLRKDKHVIYQEKELPIRNLPWYEKDTAITIYGHTLRVVVSEKLSERRDNDGKEEPWYILTNDFTTPKEAVIARYYFRFEIEETFRDAKHIVDLKTFYKISKVATFTILLWFCVLFLWLSFLLQTMQEYARERVHNKRRKRLSAVKFLAEHIQLKLFSSFKMQFF